MEYTPVRHWRDNPEDPAVAQEWRVSLSSLAEVEAGQLSKQKVPYCETIDYGTYVSWSASTSERSVIYTPSSSTTV